MFIGPKSGTGGFGSPHFFVCPKRVHSATHRGKGFCTRNGNRMHSTAHARAMQTTPAMMNATPHIFHADRLSSNNHQPMNSVNT